MTERHEFLAMLHKLLVPKVYLELGVQYGHSLKLASAAELAIGVDPEPLIDPTNNQMIYRCSSNDFFTYYADPGLWINMAFIDGSHLFEDVLKDFINVEAHSYPDTVIVFDDVLPYTQEMTSRTMVPGHWTGDAWKVAPVLKEHRPDLHIMLVDTEPTGTMVVWGTSGKGALDLVSRYHDLVDEYRDRSNVPESVLKRTEAVPVETVLALLEQELVHGSR